MSTSARSLNSIRRCCLGLAEIAMQWLVGDLASDEHAIGHRGPGKTETPYIWGDTLPRYLRRDIGFDPI